MKVSRIQIVCRGLTNRCSNCGGRTLFVPNSFFKVNKECVACGFTIERANDEGFFIGSMSLNYGMTVMLYLMPVLLLAYYKVIGVSAAMALAGCGVHWISGAVLPLVAQLVADELLSPLSSSSSGQRRQGTRG